MMQYDTIVPPLRDSVVRKVMDFFNFQVFLIEWSMSKGSSLFSYISELDNYHKS